MLHPSGPPSPGRPGRDRPPSPGRPGRDRPPQGRSTNWHFTPGCSPCGATGNEHMLVTGRKVGFGKEAD